MSNTRIIISSFAFLFIALFSVSCDNDPESTVLLFASDIKAVRRDTVQAGDHIVYEIYSRTLNQKIVRISLTESGNEGLKNIVTVRENDGTELGSQLGKKEIKKFLLDYTSPVIYREPTSIKDSVSVFTMLFEAEDETGETQNFRKQLYLIKKEISVTPDPSLPINTPDSPK